MSPVIPTLPSSAGRAAPLERLPRLPFAELRALWSAHMGRAALPAQKRLLVRELAWRIQERTHGGLDAQTRRLLSAAIRAVNPKAAPGADDRDEPAAGIPAPTRRPRGDVPSAPVSDMPSAVRLTRTWRGAVHEVYILSGGREFRYQDRSYTSLSEIAREITGTRWSGPRFFGVGAGAVGDDESGVTAMNGKAKRRRPGGNRP